MPIIPPIIPGESSLSFTRTEALAVIGEKAFGGDDYLTAGWNAKQTAQANSVLQSALRLVYGSHDWSFLQPWANGVFEVGVESYDLPEDFGGPVGNIVYTGRWSGHRPIMLADMNLVERELGTETGYPDKYAIEILPHSGESQGQRLAIRFNRKPSVACTFRLQYFIHPYDLSTTRSYPLGGPDTAELLKWACKAMVEVEIQENPNGSAMAHFERILRDAVRVDLRKAPSLIGVNGTKRLVPSSADAPLYTGQVTYNGNPVN